ncbi:NYN domain-containing protein, partial [Cellulomonas shaoxiangyii]
EERRAAADLAAQAADARRAAAAERAAARDQVRTGRALADARTRLLLDTLLDAAAGLRAELALPPVARTPAEIVAPSAPPAGDRPTSRGRTVEDPALLDELLRLPRAHLLVDGYNVSKTGWPGLPLADQRRVLVDSLARLVAHSGAEVTCCFDGADGHRAPAQQRGVRVAFSSGEIADDLLRRLVAAEPAARCSSSSRATGRSSATSRRPAPGRCRRPSWWPGCGASEGRTGRSARGRTGP